MGGADGWIHVYDLARDREYIERVQMATVQGSDFALARDHGLFASSGWWEAVEDGRLPARDLEGVITRVYVNAAKWPEFEMQASGELSTWALEGEAAHYKPGRRVRLRCVTQRYAKPPADGEPETPVVIGIWVAG